MGSEQILNMLESRDGGEDCVGTHNGEAGPKGVTPVLWQPEDRVTAMLALRRSTDLCIQLQGPRVRAPFYKRILCQPIALNNGKRLSRGSSNHRLAFRLPSTLSKSCDPSCGLSRYSCKDQLTFVATWL